jgi:hypothetical protein
MSVTAQNGEYVIRQSFVRANYQPGKGQRQFITFVPDAQTPGFIQRVGYFSSSTTPPYIDDFDGLYFEDDGTDRKFIVSKVGVPNAVTQSDWDDPLDGSGPSGIDLDWTSGKLMFIDFAWLGLGPVQFGFIIGGVPVVAHKFAHEAIGSVYIRSPNQPVRYEIRSTGGAGTLKQLCSAVMSEGGEQRLGNTVPIGTEGTPLNADVGGTMYALLGMRLKPDALDVVVIPEMLSMIVTSADTVEWQLLRNPVVAGTFTYSGVTNHPIERAVGATANTVTGGDWITGGWIERRREEMFPSNMVRPLGVAIDGTPEEYVLAVRALGNQVNTYATWVSRYFT